MSSSDSDTEGPIAKQIQIHKEKQKLRNQKKPRISYKVKRGIEVVNRRVLAPCPVCGAQTKQPKRHLDNVHRDLSSRSRKEFDFICFFFLFLLFFFSLISESHKCMQDFSFKLLLKRFKALTLLRPYRRQENINPDPRTKCPICAVHRRRLSEHLSRMHGVRRNSEEIRNKGK